MRDLSNRIQWQMPMGSLAMQSFSPDGRALLVSDSPSAFEMRDAAKGRVLWKKSIARAAWNARAWRADSSVVVVDTNDEFQFLGAASGQLLRAVPHNPSQDFVLAPDGAQIYSIDFDGHITRQRLK